VEAAQRQRKVYFDKKVKKRTLSAGMWCWEFKLN
jgi:hypothetical protein